MPSLSLAATRAQVGLHNKILWHNVLPVKVKRCMSEVISLGLLTWSDLLEDGNLFWEVRGATGGTRPRVA